MLSLVSVHSAGVILHVTSGPLPSFLPTTSKGVIIYFWRGLSHKAGESPSGCPFDKHLFSNFVLRFSPLSQPLWDEDVSTETLSFQACGTSILAVASFNAAKWGGYENMKRKEKENSAIYCRNKRISQSKSRATILPKWVQCGNKTGPTAPFPIS